MRTWFVSINEQVRGPFTQDEIKTHLAEGTIPLDSRIWGRGQTDWVIASNWMKAPQAAVIDPVRAKQEQAWHYAVQGVSKGPMPRAQLVNELRATRQKDEVLVWTKGMKAWSDLFEFHDLLEEIGLNKREHPRAAIDGQVVLKTEDGKAIIGQLKSISPGGLGVGQIIEPLSIGQVVTVEVRSPMLGDTIATKATVQYVTDSAFVGMKFVSVSMESKSRILEYVRTSDTIAQRAAA